MKGKFLIPSLLVLLLMPLSLSAALKYGAEATPLSAKTKSDYFKKNEAPDFWALMPYYVGQQNDSACSAAALTTVLNASRKATSLNQDDELITQDSLISTYSDDRYKYNVSGDPALSLKHGIVRLGVSVERLGEILTTAANKLKILNKKTVIEIIDIDFKDLTSSKNKFHEMLVKNEKSSNDFIILNFTQGVLTGDGAGMIGHIAAVGAYDALHKRVLVLDPDRKWYEPYWVSEEKVFEAVSDKKSDAKPGYIYFKYQ